MHVLQLYRPDLSQVCPRERSCYTARVCVMKGRCPAGRATRWSWRDPRGKVELLLCLKVFQWPQRAGGRKFYFPVLPFWMENITYVLVSMVLVYLPWVRRDAFVEVSWVGLQAKQFCPLTCFNVSWLLPVVLDDWATCFAPIPFRLAVFHGIAFGCFWRTAKRHHVLVRRTSYDFTRLLWFWWHGP